MDQLRSKATQQLRRENKPHAISQYYWDKKAKKGENNDGFGGI